MFSSENFNICIATFFSERIHDLTSPCKKQFKSFIVFLTLDVLEDGLQNI